MFGVVAIEPHSEGFGDLCMGFTVSINTPLLGGGRGRGRGEGGKGGRGEGGKGEGKGGEWLG